MDFSSPVLASSFSAPPQSSAGADLFNSDWDTFTGYFYLQSDLLIVVVLRSVLEIFYL